MILELAHVASPVGSITLAVSDLKLCALNFTDRWERLAKRLQKRFGNIEFRRADDPAGVVGCLRAYFAGDLLAIDGITVDLGGTAFQRSVWKALRAIPAGRAISYSDLARSIGAPTAVRAVGAANGSNPVGIVVPCHRVIGADGRLTGYGGGIERKRWLLEHEGVLLKSGAVAVTDAHLSDARA